jgi:hypothetical protein
VSPALTPRIGKTWPTPSTAPTRRLSFVRRAEDVQALRAGAEDDKLVAIEKACARRLGRIRIRPTP